MILFFGELSNKCQSFLIKKTTKTLWLIALITTLIISTPIIILGIFINNWFFLFLVLAFLTVLLLTSDIKKNIVSNMPKKILIENNSINIESEKSCQKKPLSAVKEVIDYNEWYQVIFYFGNKSSYFICQKDLIVQGTIEEFEKIFEGKIVRACEKKKIKQ